MNTLYQNAVPKTTKSGSLANIFFLAMVGAVVAIIAKLTADVITTWLTSRVIL
jgi:hypothetical protein